MTRNLLIVTALIATGATRVVAQGKAKLMLANTVIWSGVTEAVPARRSRSPMAGCWSWA